MTIRNDERDRKSSCIDGNAAGDGDATQQRDFSHDFGAADSGRVDESEAGQSFDEKGQDAESHWVNTVGKDEEAFFARDPLSTVQDIADEMERYGLQPFANELRAIIFRWWFLDFAKISDNKIVLCSDFGGFGSSPKDIDTFC
ncbi:hypothetical protein [Jannaschia ovalis]|uniref:Uncharacterized protein n=1 Tax=Jannaschia ovalis TaxID=3038773 RepID=A0ABY8LB86_9RHOB|nr:hypothetical protein [Jannaschia sp. GRR-S6-38]WGH78592.1 hypothetical protein P8627_16500 [Jannaschia sp. GRR-S6-38]